MYYDPCTDQLKTDVLFPYTLFSSMAEGEKLENPFAKGAGAGGSNSDRDGFLAFSSSTPRGSPSGGGPRGFRPKWGKANRQDNWRRFGQYNDQQEQQQMNMSAPNGEISSNSHHVQSVARFESYVLESSHGCLAAPVVGYCPSRLSEHSDRLDGGRCNQGVAVTT